MNMIRTRGHVLVTEIANRCSVTTQSVRRDLLELERQELIERVHGGAIVTDSVANVSYPARLKISTSAKEAIGHAAAALVPNGSSLFINVGTTTEAATRHLVNRRDLLVVTNNINVVNILHGNERIKTLVAAGTVRNDGAITGETAVGYFSGFMTDYALIGTSAIDERGILLDFDAYEVQVAQAIIKNSRKVILLADAIKFQRRAPVRIAEIESIDCLVTDRNPPRAFVQRCREADVEIIVVAQDRKTPDLR